VAHPNEDLIRRAYAAFSAGDLETVKSMMTDDIDYHVAGSGLISGDYHGPDDVTAMFVRVFELSGGTFHLELEEVLANDKHGVALFTAYGERNGQALTAHQVQLFDIDGDKAAEIWTFAKNQAALDEFFS